MNEHEIEKLACAIAAKVCEGHTCKFKDEERAELHRLAETGQRVRKYTLNAVIYGIIGFVLVVIGLGIKSALKE